MRGRDVSMDPGDWVNFVSGDEKWVRSGESSGLRESDFGSCDGSREDLRFNILRRLLKSTNCSPWSVSAPTFESLPRDDVDMGLGGKAGGKV